MSIVTKALSFSKFLFSKKYSMKIVMSAQEFTLSGRTNMFNLQFHLYLTHYGHLL